MTLKVLKYKALSFLLLFFSQPIMVFFKFAIYYCVSLGMKMVVG